MDNTLIFREREYLDDFLMENQLMADIYDGPYMDILEKLLAMGGCELGAVRMFNAAYKQCLEVLEDPHPEDRFSSKFLKRANQYAFTHESIFIVALTYGILSLSEHREMRTVKNFFRKVNALPSRYDFIMDIMHAFVQSKQGASYHFTLIPQQRAMARGDMFEQEQMMARVPRESNATVERILMQMIVVGESYPASQNDKAEAFRQFLVESMLEGIIPQGVITSETKERILRLGRKEQGMSVSARSLFEVSGNENVTIGGAGYAEA